MLNNKKLSIILKLKAKIEVWSTLFHKKKLLDQLALKNPLWLILNRVNKMKHNFHPRIKTNCTQKRLDLKSQRLILIQVIQNQIILKNLLITNSKAWTQCKILKIINPTFNRKRKHLKHNHPKIYQDFGKLIANGVSHKTLLQKTLRSFCLERKRLVVVRDNNKNQMIPTAVVITDQKTVEIKTGIIKFSLLVRNILIMSVGSGTERIVNKLK